ncbi:MAG: SHOCT domain-containing protein [Candidatus Aquicultorales bacterium]
MERELIAMMFGTLAILGIAAYLLWDHMQKEQEQTPSRNRALDVLRERYARGEISKEEYEEKRRLLESS